MNLTVKTTLLALAIAVAGASFAFAQTPTPGPKVIGHCTLENGVRRAAVKWEPKVAPTPASTASPKPLPCTTLAQALTEFDLPSNGDGIQLCFDVPADYPNALVEVKHNNAGNFGCATLESTFVNAGGQMQYQTGNQIGGVLPAKPAGRFYFWVRVVPNPPGSEPACTKHKFGWQ